MVYFITDFLYLTLFTQGIKCFFRFNNPQYVTAPPDLEDLEPGSYDDVLDENPELWPNPEMRPRLKYQRRLGQSLHEYEYADTSVRTDSDISIIYHPRMRTTMQTANGSKNTKYNEQISTTTPLPDPKLPQDPAIRRQLIDNKSQTDGRRLGYSKKKGRERDERKRKSKDAYKEHQCIDQDLERWEWVFLYGWNRRPFGASQYDYTLMGNYVTSCYSCGLLQYGKWWRVHVYSRYKRVLQIPQTTTCNDAFNSEDWRFKTKARYMRAQCYNNTNRAKIYIDNPKVNPNTTDNWETYHECRQPPTVKFGKEYTWEPGNPKNCFGSYTGKCVKRFLDVGRTYTERGCAAWPPQRSNSFASHRYTRLEYLLHDKDEGCVSSPLASLTPFSRSVNLYVRYHVCICTGSYCNGASQVATMPAFLIISLSFYLHSGIYPE